MAPLETQVQVALDQEWQAPVAKAAVAWQPVSISIDANLDDLSDAIKRASGEGVMIVEGLGTPAPFKTIG